MELFFSSEIRQALRRLRRRPRLTLVAVAVIGSSLALAAIAYAVCAAFLWRGLPVPDVDRIAYLEIRHGGAASNWSTQEFYDLRDRSTVFEAVHSFQMTKAALAGDLGTRRYEAALITPGLLSSLGVEPILGRGFDPADAALGAVPVALISGRLWREQFGADPSILDRTIPVNLQPTRIVGVLPDGYRFLMQEDVLFPFRLELDSAEAMASPRLKIWARLRIDATREKALKEIASRMSSAEAAPGSSLSFDLREPHYTVLDGAQPLFSAQMIAALIVLLAAALNVAQLLVGTTVLHAHDLALRNALGAGRFRLAAPILAESFWIIGCGAMIAVALTAIGAAKVDAYLQSTGVPFWVDVQLDGEVLLFLLVLCTALLFLISWIPSRTAVDTAISQSLQATATGAMRRSGFGWNRRIAWAEILIASVFLSLWGHSYLTTIAVRQTDPQMRAERVLTARIGLFEPSFPQLKDRLAFWDRLTARLEQEEAFVRTSMSTTIPYDSHLRPRQVRIRPLGNRDDAQEQSAYLNYVGTDFFDVLGAPPREGRAFDAADDAASIILDKATARSFWPAGSAVGRKVVVLQSGEPDLVAEVIGVTAAFRIGRFNRYERRAVYLPLGAESTRFRWLSAETVGDPRAAAPALRAAGESIQPGLGIYWIRSMEEIVEDASFPQRLTQQILLLSSLLTLVLASLGVYAVVSLDMELTKREIGLRGALGARPIDLFRWKVLRSLRLAFSAFLGAAAATSILFLVPNPVGEAVLDLLYGVEPPRIEVFAGVGAAVLLLVVNLSLEPTRRVFRASPMEWLQGRSSRSS